MINTSENTTSTNWYRKLVETQIYVEHMLSLDDTLSPTFMLFYPGGTSTFTVSTPGKHDQQRIYDFVQLALLAKSSFGFAHLFEYAQENEPDEVFESYPDTMICITMVYRDDDGNRKYLSETGRILLDDAGQRCAIQWVDAKDSLGYIGPIVDIMPQFPTSHHTIKIAQETYAMIGRRWMSNLAIEEVGVS